MERTDDAALLRQFTDDNSEDAFATLVSRHINLVYSVALRQVKDPHQAQDVTQAVFIILARKAVQLRHHRALSSWLFQTTRLTANNFLRSEIRRRHRDQEAYLQSTSNPTEAEVWWRIAPLLDGAVASLSEKDRQAIVLQFYEGKDLRETSLLLGASHDAVEKRIQRAVEKLQRFFSKRGVALSTAAIAGAASANSVQAAPPVLAKTVGAAVLSTGTEVASATATLVTATVRVMAWTKAKMAAAVAALLILVAGTGTVFIKTVQNALIARYPDIEGIWQRQMRLDEPGVEASESSRTRLVLKFIKGTQAYTATADWVDKGRKNVPMGRVVYRYPSLRLEWNPRQTWLLSVNPKATKLILQHAIHFIQPDPVELTRTTKPALVPEPLAEGDFAPHPGSDLQGYWTGAIGDGPDAVPVRLKVAQNVDGTFRAEGDDPMHGANSQPVAVLYHRPAVEFRVASGAGMFEGEINNTDTEIAGWWTQGGESLPALVKRGDYAAERRREAAKTYTSSAESDLQGHWSGRWICPFGNLKVPIRLALDIAKLPNDLFSAALADVDELGHDAFIPASTFHYDQPAVRMEWKWVGGAYEGKLEHGRLIGTWLQGGGGFPLVFERNAAK